MEINRRIKEIIDYYQLEQQEFADKIGVTSSTISVTVREKKPAGAKVILNILTEFPEVSCEWLIRGKGKMLFRKKQLLAEKDKDPPITQSEYKDLLNTIGQLQNDIADLKKEQ